MYNNIYGFTRVEWLYYFLCIRVCNSSNSEFKFVNVIILNLNIYEVNKK